MRLELQKLQFHPVLRIRIRIRIRMDPHDFGLLDPHLESHSKCGFQMRMRIRINYVKISVENLFTNMIINIMW